MQSEARFNYRVNKDLVIIEDAHGYISVTQDAERVLADIQTELGSLEGKYIIWKDGQGIWDALEWRDDRVQMFPLGDQVLDAAIKTLRNHLSTKGLHWSQQDNAQMQKQSDEGTLHRNE